MVTLIGSLVGFVLALRLERPIHNITTALDGIMSGQQIEAVSKSGPHWWQGYHYSWERLPNRLD